jgi:hypothetical protein
MHSCALLSGAGRLAPLSQARRVRADAFCAPQVSQVCDLIACRAALARRRNTTASPPPVRSGSQEHLLLGWNTWIRCCCTPITTSTWRRTSCWRTARSWDPTRSRKSAGRCGAGVIGCGPQATAERDSRGGAPPTSGFPFVVWVLVWVPRTRASVAQHPSGFSPTSFNKLAPSFPPGLLFVTSLCWQAYSFLERHRDQAQAACETSEARDCAQIERLNDMARQLLSTGSVSCLLHPTVTVALRAACADTLGQGSWEAAQAPSCAPCLASLSLPICCLPCPAHPASCLLAAGNGACP